MICCFGQQIIEHRTKHVARSDPEESEKVMCDDVWNKTPSEGGNSSDESTAGGDTETSSVKTITLSDDIEDEMHPVTVVRRMKMYRSSKSNRVAKPWIMDIFCPPRFSAMAHIF